MKSRPCTVLFLLVVLLAARLLDVHFHLPSPTSGEAPHLVALTLIQAHHHADEADHGHIASHLFEGEADEGKGTGLLGKPGSSSSLMLPFVLVTFALLAWLDSRARPLPLPAPPPARTRRQAHNAPPPSQAPPLSI